MEDQRSSQKRCLVGLWLQGREHRVQSPSHMALGRLLPLPRLNFPHLSNVGSSAALPVFSHFIHSLAHLTNGLSAWLCAGC